MSAVSTAWRLGVFLAALVLAGCAAQPAPPVAVKPEVLRSTARYAREYIIQPGDQIQVTVFHVPELTQTTIVRPDGYTSLQLIKEVKVGGLTVTQADDELQRRYSARLVKPDVTLTILTPRQPQVYVVGEVNHPGPVALREAPTVAIALANAGGTTRTASLDAVALIRLEEDGHLTGTIIPPEKAGETALYQATDAMLLKSGDIVVVPESSRSQFVRFVQDYINTPTTAISQSLTPYLQYETLRLIQREIGSAAFSPSIAVTP